MQLYSVSENGALRKVIKLDFNENKVFLVDDIKTIYIWNGLRASQKKKELAIKKGKILSNKREKPSKIQIINQNQEYGSFLAIKDILKAGLKPDNLIERRPELKIKFKDTMELIEIGIDPDLEAKITIAAHKLLQEKKSYKDLSIKLAELQLKLLQDKDIIPKNEIQKKAEEILKSSTTYEELTWLISELDILLKKKYVDQNE